MAKRPKQRPVDTRTDIEKESDRLLQDIQINEELGESGPVKRPEPKKYKSGNTTVLTPTGRQIWQGVDGSIYSEVTTTLEIPDGSGKWYTIPTIDEKGNKLTNERATE